MKSVELRVLCEGATERNFVTAVLRPHLLAFRVFATGEGLLGRGAGGGTVPWDTLRKHIKRSVGRSRDHQFTTTLVDLYALHGYPEVDPALHGVGRARAVEAAMAEELPSPRFLPHLQVHEFEALILVDPERLASAFPGEDIGDAIARLRTDVGATPPEEIDDGANSAPSKRIVNALPGYALQKATAGPLIAARIGVATLRGHCPHFGEWLSRLEGLAPHG